MPPKKRRKKAVIQNLKSTGDYFFDRVLPLVQSYGHAVQTVFPTGEADELVYSYTVGLAAKGLPDLIMFGLDPELATRLLNSIAQAIEDMLSIPKTPIETLDDALLNGIVADYPVKLVLVHEVEKFYEYAKFADRFLDVRNIDSIGELQILFPDQFGKFPGDPECQYTNVPLL